MAADLQARLAHAPAAPLPARRQASRSARRITRKSSSSTTRSRSSAGSTSRTAAGTRPSTRATSRGRCDPDGKAVPSVPRRAGRSSTAPPRARSASSAATAGTARRSAAPPEVDTTPAERSVAAAGSSPRSPTSTSRSRAPIPGYVDGPAGRGDPPSLRRRDLRGAALDVSREPVLQLERRRRRARRAPARARRARTSSSSRAAPRKAGSRSARWACCAGGCTSSSRRPTRAAAIACCYPEVPGLEMPQPPQRAQQGARRRRRALRASARPTSATARWASTPNATSRSKRAATSASARVDRGPAQPPARASTSAPTRKRSRAEIARNGGSLIKAIEALQRPGERTLEPIEPRVPPEIDALVPASAVVDPERPMDPDELVQEFVPPAARKPVAGRVWRVARGARHARRARGGVALDAAARLDRARRRSSTWRAALDELARRAARRARRVRRRRACSSCRSPRSSSRRASCSVRCSAAVYAFAGALLSAAVTYWIGRRVGRHAVRRLAGTRLNRITRRLAKKGTARDRGDAAAADRAVLASSTRSPAHRTSGCATSCSAPRSACCPASSRRSSSSIA